FWSWNNRLDPDQLKRQIGYFQAMGMGGFHIHARTGLETPYLGEEFMGVVRACTEEAARRGLLAWLYDEDRWPSGYGGGLVTREPRFRARHLLFTCRPYGHGAVPPANRSRAMAGRMENGRLIGRYEVVLEEGRLANYRFLRDGATASGRVRVWFAYLETAEPTDWFNHQTYVDTLNPEATRRFIEVTHERYAKAVGEHFGKTIPAIFTDEPQFPTKTFFQSPHSGNDIFFPFTSDLLETYAEAYGQRLEESLPELFWELPEGRASVARYRYHDHVCERFASAYADVLGKWCEEHGLALTGHMMEEPSLHSQAGSLGEAMRSYRAFQLPGIDMLCDRREYTTAKQAQSAARQYGRQGVLSELYGVTGWDFDFAGHNAEPSEAPARLAAHCAHAAFTRTAILQELEPFREVGVCLESGEPADTLLSQLRLEGEERFLFLCYTDRVGARGGTAIMVRGDWSMTKMDTLAGGMNALAAEYRDGWTRLRHDFSACGSLLLRLEPGRRSEGAPYIAGSFRETARLQDPIPVSLSEPNVLLLDQAQWRIDRGAWQPLEEMLRLDNLVRRALQLPDRIGAIPQPWTDTEPAPVLANVELRFRITSDIAVEAPLLALEKASSAIIALNGKRISSETAGWWVDEAIQTVKLPRLAFPPFEVDLGSPGADNHMLEITAFGNRSNAFGPVHACAAPRVWQTSEGVAFAEVHGSVLACPASRVWQTPGSYRTAGENWSYEYRLMPMGILCAPMMSLQS
ncbi:MAG: hypothetical protein M0Q93_07165, partial [Terrimicrobiaceae bacterium]|nr:hypothetical protein [Terrimicrobiaceae bacterium]